jgi:hypothetical protein
MSESDAEDAPAQRTIGNDRLTMRRRDQIAIAREGSEARLAALVNKGQIEGSRGSWLTWERTSG